MKKMMTYLKTAKAKAFTLVEMLVVLLIISVLLLLFVPNLTKQKEAVNDKGKAAVVKVVESQAELYSLDKNEDATLSKLQDDGRITEEQAKAYKEYHAKQNKTTFAAVEEQIFFMEFEELYRETQKRSVASQQKTSLSIDGKTIRNGSQKLTVPKGIQAPSGQSITFDRAGGNSSLAKVEFQTSKGAIRYQLYLGNGKIKRIKETKN